MSVTSELWFEEKLELDSGRTLKIRINRLIEQFESPYQRIEVYETVPFGRMLVLDGVIMCTEWDEHAYHEMITHVPLFTHAKPERVLVIGGGDGGTIREVLRHPSVAQADLCEIDGDVVRLSRTHLPSMACALDDPRVTIYHEDGAKFIAERPNHYDIIIVDSSDPIGPAEVLFSEEFYVAMRGSLREDGIAVTQSESFYYHASIVKRLTGFAKKHYAVAGYYNTIVPTYPSGIIGFTMCSKKYHPLRDFNEARVTPMQGSLRYYNPGIHRGAFDLPSFIKNEINL
ncbi:MAG TPA: polyamine aminopropyltransferase [Spirochaetota bacterium]|nr:polyamine aminopropyltransferase [Spirochaetota bacterium]HNT10506.1 polyamine aminopropyltransferase [Spirochaetota bacterium]HNV48404.1 polyamine aminopropyltransferase [Spirochaetota bacterium]HOS40801.1 polyamine aminopropyltransferase [Spirochaetota bacterium]HPU88395.1 polyamine aminopropyltransferase [Spirochaetota bacterium]